MAAANSACNYVRVKVVEDMTKLSATEMLPKAFSYYRYITYNDTIQETLPSGRLNAGWV